MEAFQFLTGLIPLAVLIGLIWFVARAVGRARSGPDADPAATLRRLFLYGLLYVTLLVGGQGVIEVGREVVDPEPGRSNTGLARALAFLIVGAPAYLALVRYVDRRLSGSETERRAMAWTIYLDLTLLTALVASMVGSQAVLRSLLDPDGADRLDRSNLIAAVVWGAIWVWHWFVLRRRHRPRGDLDLASGTVAGLAPLGIGLAGLLYVLADELYTVITDDPQTDRGGPSTGAWAATAIVGGVVWGWYWLRHYRTAPRTGLWYVTVVPIGALAGFVAMVSAVATLANITLIWFLGDPGADDAVRHFDDGPGLVAVAVVGAGALLYHHSLLSAETARNDAIRSYDYLLATAALVTAMIGIVVLLSEAFGIGRSARANVVLTGVTMLLVGGPIWFWFWRKIMLAVAGDRIAELQSPLRRLYLFSIFGVGGLAVLVASLVVLTTALEDALDGVFGRQTLDDTRVGLAVVLAVVGVAYYHLAVYRSEREDAEPPPVMPPPPLRPARRLVLVSADGERLAARLHEATGLPVVQWHRTDGGDAGTRPATETELASLCRRIARWPGQDLLIVADGADGHSVIPIERSTGATTAEDDLATSNGRSLTPS